MKLLSLTILRWAGVANPIICCSATELSSIGYFQRGSAKEFLVFLSRTLASRVQPNTRVQVDENEHVLYVYKRSDGCAIVAACDADYNSRVAFSLVTSTLNEFADKFKGKFENVTQDEQINWPDLSMILARYQDPNEADKILKIKKDIDETKIIMHQAIDSVLQRGEKIDDLVSKSEDLGGASKTFYKTAKKNNSCCTVM